MRLVLDESPTSSVASLVYLEWTLYNYTPDQQSKPSASIMKSITSRSLYGRCRKFNQGGLPMKPHSNNASKQNYRYRNRKYARSWKITSSSIVRPQLIYLNRNKRLRYAIRSPIHHSSSPSPSSSPGASTSSLALTQLQNPHKHPLTTPNVVSTSPSNTSFFTNSRNTCSTFL